MSFNRIFVKAHSQIRHMDLLKSDLSVYCKTLGCAFGIGRHSCSSSVVGFRNFNYPSSLALRIRWHGGYNHILSNLCFPLHDTIQLHCLDFSTESTHPGLPSISSKKSCWTLWTSLSTDWSIGSNHACGLSSRVSTLGDVVSPTERISLPPKSGGQWG